MSAAEIAPQPAAPVNPDPVALGNSDPVALGNSDPVASATTDQEPPATSGPATDTGAVIMVCPDGPLLVRGDFTVVDAAGRDVPGARRTSAFCRCGKSRDKPFCDGTHKAARFRAP